MLRGVQDCAAAIRDIPADSGDLHNNFAPDEPPWNGFSGGATLDELLHSAEASAPISVRPTEVPQAAVRLETIRRASVIAAGIDGRTALLNTDGEEKTGTINIKRMRDMEGAIERFCIPQA